jgi:hypothetical protein
MLKLLLLFSDSVKNYVMWNTTNTVQWENGDDMEWG